MKVRSTDYICDNCDDVITLITPSLQRPVGIEDWIVITRTDIMNNFSKLYHFCSKKCVSEYFKED